MMSQGKDLYFEANVTNSFTILKGLNMCSLNNNLLFRLFENGYMQETEKEKEKKPDWMGAPFCLQHQCTMFVKRGLNPRKQGELPGDSQFSSRPSFYIKKQLLVNGCHMELPL